MSVLIGYAHGEKVHHCFLESLLRSIARLPFLDGVQSASAGAFSLDRARNGIVEKFLDTKSEWLLMIDTDMQWKPEDISSLLASSHFTKRPVIGGLCFTLKGVNDDIGPVVVPAMWRFDEAGMHRLVMEYSGIERVDVTGAAFLLVHRHVFKMISGANWFGWHEDQLTASEDWAFCLRLRDHGIPLHVNTNVKIGHTKSLILGERDFAEAVEKARKVTETVS